MFATERIWRRRAFFVVIPAALAACGQTGNVFSGSSQTASLPPTQTVSDRCPDPSNTGLVLQPGFCANVFADSLGAARHLVVAPNGDVFVSVQSRPTASGVNVAGPSGIVGLRDTNGDGRADAIERFADAGGTDIKLWNGYLYHDLTTSIVRYPFHLGELHPAADSSGAEVVVEGMPARPGHSSKSFVITADGSLYSNIGSPSNACQQRDRQSESSGIDPCPQVATRAGIWRFDANRLHQTPSLASRFATGIRNTVAIALRPGTDEIWLVQHGRDQLAENWPSRFSADQGAELPGEILIHLRAGENYGWPYCYWDPIRRAQMLAPEYGGDGSTAGRCDAMTKPVGAFPAHWAPNDMLFYTGSALPARYRDGVFVVFHGSWNRPRGQQQGFNIVFAPSSGWKSPAEFEVFASGFAGSPPDRSTAAHRPTGIAQGIHGELFVSDDTGGRIYRITYQRR
jgi:glucose/arabinose dehydrogenase